MNLYFWVRYLLIRRYIKELVKELKICYYFDKYFDVVKVQKSTGRFLSAGLSMHQVSLFYDSVESSLLVGWNSLLVYVGLTLVEMVQ
jgi:hypothetical protein